MYEVVMRADRSSAEVYVFAGRSPIQPKEGVQTEVLGLTDRLEVARSIARDEACRLGKEREQGEGYRAIPTETSDLVGAVYAVQAGRFDPVDDMDTLMRGIDPDDVVSGSDSLQEVAHKIAIRTGCRPTEAQIVAWMEGPRDIARALGL